MHGTFYVGTEVPDPSGDSFFTITFTAFRLTMRGLFVILYLNII